MKFDIEQSSGDVYADLGLPNADEMRVKARLAVEIGELVERGRCTRHCAPQVSQWLRGQFRDASEAQMRDVLTRLRHDFQ
jgi:predicted XRE-type DNA-binding protein